MELAYRASCPTVTGRGLIPSSRRGPLVIGRDLCSFSWIDQRDQKDRAARRREAELEGLRIALSPEPGLFVVLWSASAAVWTWDEARIQQELTRAEREDLKDLPRVPEPLILAPEIASSATRLVACLDGVEGQVWRSGELVGSRWWRDKPNDREWSLFCASLNIEAGFAPPVLTPDPLARPWRINEHRAQNAELIDKRVIFWGGALVAALALSGAAFITGLELTHARLNAHVDALEAQAAPVREAHSRVMSAIAEHRKISEPIAGTDPLRLVSSAAEVVAASGVRAREVQLRNDRLVLVLAREHSAAVDGLLRQLEASPDFAGARISQSNTASQDIQIEAALETAP